MLLRHALELYARPVFGEAGVTCSFIRVTPNPKPYKLPTASLARSIFIEERYTQFPHCVHGLLLCFCSAWCLLPEPGGQGRKI